MKKFILFIALFVGLLANDVLANNDKSDEILRKSGLNIPAGPAPNSAGTTYPIQFNETNTDRQGVNRAASTGYYFVDSDDRSIEWGPKDGFVDTTFQPTTWRRILPGPRLLDSTYWQTNKEEGLRFFRNPAQVNFFRHRDANNNPIVVDSTDNAIAGPIPIGFGFYFNGIRYDSFYVSTNGVIALTNRRYYYNSAGQRTIPPGATTAYDPMSMDWFVRTTRVGNGLNDPEPDDFGYRVSVLNNQITNATAGIRANGGNQLQNLSTTTNRGAYIAPFWGPMHLSQWSVRDNRPDDHGRVYYKREVDGSKLTIYFVNIAPQAGTYQFPQGTYSAQSNRRPGDVGYVSANAQVILNRLDSSITIYYEKFTGMYPISARQKVPSATAFGVLATAGVTGWARDAAYDTKTGTGSFPWGPTSASEYQQTTHYFDRVNSSALSYLWPHDDLAVRFKQWKNTLRVVDIQWRVRDENTAASDLSFSKQITTEEAANYELLAGEPKLGAIQPVALIQNVSNDIQGPYGVNFTPQDAIFRARFMIYNLATYTENPVTKFRQPIPRVVYNRLIRVTQKCLNLAAQTADPDCGDDPYTMVRLSNVTKNGNNYNATHVFPLPAGVNGIPPYRFVQVFFPPFEPNEYIPDHIGRMRAFIIADANTSPDPSLPPLGDSWPFDDTTNVDFIVMKRLQEFNDDFSEYHSIYKVAMPSVHKWVNIGAIVADGEQNSRYPLPPRGIFSAVNSTNDQLRSPVLHMNRKNLDGSDWSPNQNTPGGDIVTSFPIDLRNKRGAVLSFAIQRTINGPDNTWDRGFSDQQIVGVEGRLISNLDKATLYTNAASVSRPDGDSIVVEFMRPSPDGIKFVTNVKDYNRWRWHPVPNSTPYYGIPAFALFGMGGYFMGWDEKNPNVPLKRDPTTNPNENGLRFDQFDDGIDWGFRRFQIQIPDSFILAPNDGAKNFRFRIRVNARNHWKGQPPNIQDDDDDFLVDNVRIVMPSNKPDLEVTQVRPLWPYTLAPASQATDIPILVNLSNNSDINASSFKVKVKVFRGAGSFGDPVYCRVIELANLNARRSIEVSMPNWNAKVTGEGTYRIQAISIFEGGDSYIKNDTTYTDFQIKFGDSFAYDNPNREENQLPEFSGTGGSGLSSFGQAYGGTGAGLGSYTNPVYVMGGNGAGSGSGSGQFAMKFTLFNADTLYGYKALFGSLNQAMNDIAFSVYTGDPNVNTPISLYTNSNIVAKRGLGSGMIFPQFDRYVLYKVTDYGRQPIILNKGTYWISIAQLGLEGLHLGATGYRMGMRTTSQYVDPQTNLAGTALACNLMIDKQFRKWVNNEYINDNFFCYEDLAGSGQWTEFMKTYGNPAFAHLHHWGIPPQDGTTRTFSRGTFIPMIRPYFGFKVYEPENVVQICIDDIPVELLDFRYDIRSNVGIDLFWETASEINNYGFYIERRKAGENESDWKTIGFVHGANNSSTIRHYNFTDRSVKLNETYQYRLRQTDMDGTQYCPTSEVLTVTFDMVDELKVAQNSPNPFRTVTNIDFNMPATQNARIEVIDMFGNLVKVLYEGQLQRGLNTVSWDGTNSNGVIVPAGTYIYRISSGNEVVTGKMSFVK